MGRLLLRPLQVMNFMNKLAGNEYVGFSNATWVTRYRNTLNIYANDERSCKWLSLSVSLCVSVSSQSASLETETLPSATTWRRRRWGQRSSAAAASAGTLLNLKFCCSKPRPWLCRYVMCVFVLSVFSWGNRHDLHPRLLLPGEKNVIMWDS